MTNTLTDEQLKSTARQLTRMDDTLVAHLAGVFDAVGSITVHVSKDSGYSTGFRVKPLLRLHRDASDEALLGMVDAYCEEHGVQYSLHEKEREDSMTYQFVIKDPDSIRRFLEPLTPHLVSKYEEASIMLDEVLPRIEDGYDKSEDGILELIPYADRLRQRARYGSESQYDEQFFRKKFA